MNTSTESDPLSTLGKENASAQQLSHEECRRESRRENNNGAVQPAKAQHSPADDCPLSAVTRPKNVADCDKNAHNAGLRSSWDFVLLDTYYHRERIVDVLINMRLSSAANRHPIQLAVDISATAMKMPPVPEVLYHVLPSRNEWHQHRPRQRDFDDNVALISLRRAVAIGLAASNPPHWVARLNTLVGQIQNMALAPDGYRFGPPTLLPEPKNKANEFRILSFFPKLIDCVVDRILAHYLKDQIDAHLTDSALSDRAHGRKHGRDRGIQDISKFQAEHTMNDLWVGETDIRSFYDVVPHNQIRLGLSKSGIKLDTRALATVEHLFANFNYSHVRAAQAKIRIEHRIPEAIFPWPECELRALHQNIDTVPMGLMQGSALSGVLINVVMQEADNSVRAAMSATDQAGLYRRFVDDVIFIGTTHDVVERGQTAYVAAVTACGLPVHAARRMTDQGHGPLFYCAKSKAPYRWCFQKTHNCSPWVHFLGYAIRCDGLLRVRQLSLKKHRRKLAAETEHIIETASRLGRRMSLARILLKASRRITAMGVGRKRSRCYGSSSDLCWAGGFRLCGMAHPVLPQLKSLDRTRGRILKHLARSLASLAHDKKEAKSFLSTASKTIRTSLIGSYLGRALLASRLTSRPNSPRPKAVKF